MTRKNKTSNDFRAEISHRTGSRRQKQSGKNEGISSSSDVMLNQAEKPTNLSDLEFATTPSFDSSSEALGKVFNSINLSIAYLDASANFLQVNDAFARSLNQTPEYFIGKNAFDLNPNPEGRSLFKQVLRTGRPISAFDIPFQDPSHPGHTSYWDWSLQPIAEPDGEISGMIFTSVEVTERMHAEKALEETQALFELLFESSPDANILTGENGHILALNRRAEKLFGYQRGVLIGKPISFLISEEGRENQLVLQEEDTSYERVAYRLDGSSFPVNIITSPLKTEHGTLILRVVHDISEQKKAEQSLRASEARFHAIFDKASLGIQLLEAGGTILETNPAMQVMLGYTAEELRGMSFHEFTYAQDLPKNLALYDSLLKGEIMQYQLEKRYRRKDGSLFWGRQNVSRYGEELGKPPYVIVLVDNINELKEADQALKTSEERFRTSVEALLDGFAILSAIRDRKGKIIDFCYEYVNEAGCRLNQRTREQQVGHSLLELLPNHGPTGILQRYAQVVETGEPLVMESFDYEDTFGSGELARRAFDAQIFKLGDGIAISWHDVTPRKQAEEALRRQEALLRKVIETLPVGVWITDRDGKIQFGNEAGRQIWRGPENVTLDQYDQFIGYWPATGKRIVGDEWAIWRALKHGLAVIEDEIIIQSFDGDRKTILNSAVPIRDENGEISGAILVNQDISERKQMQTELAEVQRKLLDKAEEERLHLARDLHDGPIQDLYGMSFQLKELLEQLQDCDARDLVDKASFNLQSTITSLRSIMSSLRPPTLTPFGLERTIRSHSETFQQMHPEIRLHLDLMRDGQKLPETVRIGLFRIYQESLNNIRRHAQAHNIFVRFEFDDQRVELTVQDDGIGFQVPNHWVVLPRQGHYGLVGMRERAEALGGQFELSSTPGKGTNFKVVVPVKG